MPTDPVIKALVGGFAVLVFLRLLPEIGIWLCNRRDRKRAERHRQMHQRLRALATQDHRWN